MPMPMPNLDLPISIHDVDPQVLIPALQSHLPYSLPLLRRLQHSLAHRSPTAKSLAIGDLKPASDSNSVSASFLPGGSLPTPWLAAWVDLHDGPETQVVVYSSLEADAGLAATARDDDDGIEESDSPGVSTLRPTSRNTISPDALDRVRAQLLALLSHIQKRLMPEYLRSFTAAPDANQGDTSRANTSPGPGNDSHANPPTQPFGPRAFKIGHLHTGLFAFLTASGKYPSPLSQTQTRGPGPDPAHPHPHGPQMAVPGLRVHRFSHWNKYLFREEEFVIADGAGVRLSAGARAGAGSACPPAVTSAVSQHSNSSLPPGYRFSDRSGPSALRARHYELICRRSAVFRTPKSLASFPGVAVFVDVPSPSDTAKGGDDEDPIAWAFLTADGSLGVLHVEPEHRGRGVAEAASREIMRRGMREGGMFMAAGEGGTGKGWVHADVAAENRASCRVMEKLGGVSAWTIVFVMVEVDGDA